MLIRIENPWSVYGVEVDEAGVVVRAAPIAKVKAGDEGREVIVLALRAGWKVLVLAKEGWRAPRL